MYSRIYIGIIWLALVLIFACKNDFSKQSEITPKIDSLLLENNDFNGVVLIKQNEKVIYSKALGVSDNEKQVALKITDQFVIGSISKQITAVLILQEYEKGNLKLHSTIKQYFPEINQGWTDTITIHHLLTHTHGIIALDKTLEFESGTEFSYSQLGYELLANILEKIKGKSFAEISMSFFEENGLKNTFHPYFKEYENLVKGYTEQQNKALLYEENSLINYVPAGAFISNANDLSLWNSLLYNGRLVNLETLKLMSTRYATRQHPIFGQIEYGYGLLFEKGEESIQIGALGYAPGFVSACYYYPQSDISVVVLENVARKFNNFKNTFEVHIGILDVIKITINNKKSQTGGL